jgi:hypothetical protein
MGNYHVRFRGRVRSASFGGVPSLPDRSRLAQSPSTATPGGRSSKHKPYESVEKARFTELVGRATAAPAMLPSCNPSPNTSVGFVAWTPPEAWRGSIWCRLDAVCSEIFRSCANGAASAPLGGCGSISSRTSTWPWGRARSDRARQEEAWLSGCGRLDERQAVFVSAWRGATKGGPATAKGAQDSNS